MTNNDELALKSRENFEHWWQVYYHNGNPPRLGWQAWREGDGYKTDEDDSELNDLWNSWQAAQSSLLAGREADKKQIISWSFLAKKNVEEHEKAVIALDAARQRIAELESKLNQNESWSLAAQKYIADLESRTVNVNRAVGCDACSGNGSVDIDHGELGVELIECQKCGAAGIKLEVGE